MLKKMTLSIFFFSLLNFFFVNANEFNISRHEAQMGELLAFPEVSEYVREVGEKLVKASDFPDMPHQFVILNSSTPNAWAFRGGRIAITRGMLYELKNEGELAAILAHEIGHQVAYLREAKVESFYSFDNLISYYTYRLQSIFSKILERKNMRQDEYQADFDGIRFMAKAGYDLNTALEVQKSLICMSGGKREEISLGAFINRLFDTHPHPQLRLEANLHTISFYSDNINFQGKEPFLQALSRLHSTEKAYDLLDAGLEALKVCDAPKALRLAEEAEKMVPDEALFLGLKGHAYSMMKNEEAALEAYTRAILLNEQFFAFHLEKGLILFKQKNLEEAKQELEKSLFLYETPDAHFFLGAIEMKNNQTLCALEHYLIASYSESAIGHRATLELAKCNVVVLS